MKIVDNFLDVEVYQKIYNSIYSPNFYWTFSPGVAVVPDDHFFFYNFLYSDGKVTSNHYKTIVPILSKIRMTELVRAKVNGYTQSSSIIKHDFHVDFDYQCNGFLYYLNTNDGYTEFEDGKIVESVKNRALFFDSFVPHRSTTCTDEKIRITVNINYH